MRRFSFFTIAFFLMVFSAPDLRAQEFNCSLSINDEQLEGASFAYLSDLKIQIEEYINDFRWTEVEYTEEERIQCRMQLIFESSNSSFDFSARLIISLRRPIYGTNIETTSIIFSDESWQFNYPQGRALIHDELQFDSLTGLLDYYAYLMLGYDYDSFAALSGTPFFERAQQVVDLAQTTSSVGWTRSSNNRRNRYTLVSELLNSSYESLRTAYYQYHRLGLDAFTENEDGARAQILESLRLIRDNKRRATSNYLFDLFFDTKSREIAGVFEDASTALKLDAYNILAETDQGHLSDYSNMQK